jgi:hypothetical protein
LKIDNYLLRGVIYSLKGGVSYSPKRGVIYPLKGGVSYSPKRGVIYPLKGDYLSNGRG